MSDFWSLLFDPQISFLRNGFLFLILAAIPIGVVGSFHVVTKSTYFVSTVTHSSFGGIGLFLWLATLFPLFEKMQPIVGGYFWAIATMLALTLLEWRKVERLDALLSLIWSFSVALGITFMGLIKTRVIDPSRFLFGDILLITTGDLYVLFYLTLFILVLLLFYFPYVNLVAFDIEFAAVKQIATFKIQLFIRFISAIVLISMTQAVGIILVVALMSIPALIAQWYSKSLKQMMVMSSLVALVIGLISLVLSYFIQIASGPLFVICLTLTYLVHWFVKK